MNNEYAKEKNRLRHYRLVLTFSTR